MVRGWLVRASLTAVYIGKVEAMLVQSDLHARPLATRLVWLQQRLC